MSDWKVPKCLLSEKEHFFGFFTKISTQRALFIAIQQSDENLMYVSCNHSRLLMST